jgi:lipopolysaccharide export system protein LptA
VNRKSSQEKRKMIAKIALFALFVQPITPALAQMAANGGPIDIQADEQEFGEGHVIAKGRVRVTFKDSVVVGPMATLYRDAAGSPQKAVFTGHPHLIQGANKIDSDVLIFEIASQKIIADGHAHSEVMQNEPLGGSLAGGAASTEPEQDLTTPGFSTTAKTSTTSKSTKVAKGTLAKSAKPAMNKSGQINWPTKADDAMTSTKEVAATTKETNTTKESTSKTTAVKTTTAAKPAKAKSYASEEAATTLAPTPTTEELMAPPTQPVASGSSPSTPTSTTASASTKKPVAKAPPPDKIITDSRYQEYFQDTGRFEARGDVHVKHGDISVISDRLQLVYGADAKPETALFTGHVSATQNDNNTQADAMTYYLSTQRLQATGNVKSKVIQKKVEGPKKGGPDEGSQAANSTETTKFVDKTKVAESTPKTNFSFDLDNKNGEPMYIDSDAQDYSKDSGRMAAQGNCKVRYGDTTGIGPNVLLIRNIDGQAEKMIFTGRSQISQPGKRWIGDKITMMVNDRKVLAQGNTKAFILKTPGAPDTGGGIGSLGSGKRAPLVLTPTVPTASPTKSTPSADSAGTLAGNKNQLSASTNSNSNSKVSVTKIEATE